MVVESKALESKVKGLARVPPLLKSRAEMAALQALGGFGAL